MNLTHLLPLGQCRSMQRAMRLACAAVLATGAAGAMPVAAAQTAPPPAAPVPAPVPAPAARMPVGADTRALLAIQRDGSQAGATLHVPGEQAARAHARYLKSFEHAIPERFVGQAGGSSVGIGGQGAASAK